MIGDEENYPLVRYYLHNFQFHLKNAMKALVSCTTTQQIEKLMPVKEQLAVARSAGLRLAL